MLEGEFQSAFQNRIAPNNESLKPKLTSPSNKMIVFGDGDIIKNHVSSSGNAFPLGYNQFSKSQFNGNKQLIVNALNYLMDNENLINIRAKEVNLRLLNKSEIKNNRLKWQLINTVITSSYHHSNNRYFWFSEKKDNTDEKNIFICNTDYIITNSIFP